MRYPGGNTGTAALLFSSHSSYSLQWGKAGGWVLARYILLRDTLLSLIGTHYSPRRAHSFVHGCVISS
ncbi:hypothetical protein FKM82_006769 [Ascaphus truei]